MISSPADQGSNIVVDSIHGDIHLNDREWSIVDTATFQRLRHIKQLGMGHLTYPNATHTRFAHSLGAFKVMCRVLEAAQRKGADIPGEQQENLRMAALLHDVGHYPYSHLTEGIENVQLMEELVGDEAGPRTLPRESRYPGHLQLGMLVVTNQRDVIDAIGGEERARTVAAMFGRTKAADPQLSKLINSSLDMDRLDYLLRDSNAAGVPYGEIDINYLLNSVEISPSGMVCVSEKALPAAEQFLFARYFMHLTVYYHKTTYAFEEAARQLLRRVRDSSDKADKYRLPRDGSAVRDLVTSERFLSFTDAFLDRIIQEASNDDDPCIRALAKAMLARRPPKLLKEVPVLEDCSRAVHRGSMFKDRCKSRIRSLAREHEIQLERFLFCQTRPLLLEKRGHGLTAEQAREMPAEEIDELIRVFERGEEEPKPLVDIDRSIISKCAGHFFQIFRLYLVRDAQGDDQVVGELRETVKDWDKPE